MSWWYGNDGDRQFLGHVDENDELISITASEARSKALKNSEFETKKRRAKLMQDIMGNVKYGHTTACFNSWDEYNNSGINRFGNWLEEKDMDYLTNLGYIIELKTGTHKNYSRDGMSHTEHKYKYYQISW